MPSVAPNLSHMGVFTDRPEAMERFYSVVLGMVVSDRGRGSAFPRQIIFMTGDLVEEDGSGGPIRQLQKPFRISDVLALIRDVLAPRTAEKLPT